MTGPTRITVLGANSFAGRCFVATALAQGFQVQGISRSEYPSEPFQLWGKANGYHFLQLDLNRDLEAIVEALSHFRPRFVVDFAGQGMVAESWQAPEQWYQTNVVAKARLIQACKELDSLEKYIRVSTPEVYGSHEQAIDETAIFNPSTPYAVSHAAIDMHLLAYYRQFGFPAVLTRFANFYGPGQQLYRIIPRTVIFSRLGRKLPLHGGGKAERAFIYGSDVASALMAVIERGQVGETYHFSGDGIVSIRDLVARICGHLDADFEAFVKQTEDRPGKDARYLMSDAKARDALGWSPEVSLDQGIASTITWVDQHWSALMNESLNYQHKP